MKGIVLAGGAGSRLRPLTDRVNKHLLPIAGRPMIHYPLAKLVEAGIEDALVVTGREHVEAFRAALGDGSELGLRSLGFAGQDGPRGVADALRQGEAFAEAGPVCVILGDQLFETSLRSHVACFSGKGAVVLLHPTDEPQRFGIARFDGETLVEIIEKPAPGSFLSSPVSESAKSGIHRPSSACEYLAVTGIYFYDETVFDICRDLRPSARGELEITDVNNAYLRRGELDWRALDGWWIDVGTHESLAAADKMLRNTV